ncbi:flavonoid 3',5'-methyltransferase-like [Pollicipes pollicipes]|uniref:flavonoid 3',5'-methyltransferase-like n=1 Tax=Pollicipes pollicipes TaxID=41117 RepID=UPI001884D13F|nr:flavonoid 3',5'-methyltransferase-like [Pollicipes pollicipes]
MDEDMDEVEDKGKSKDMDENQDMEEVKDENEDEDQDEAQALINGGEAGTFDYAFIDADKTNYLNYYELTLQLLRVGGILVADNALRGARVLGDEDAMDENTRTIHEMNKRASSDPRVHASLLNLGDGVLFCRRVK